MTKSILFILALVTVWSCGNGSQETDSLKDSTKRNENWCWFVDSDSGEASWIKVNGSGNPVKNGYYTLFYSNGAVREKGTMKNSKNVDTAYYYSSHSYDLIKYSFRIGDTDTIASRYTKDGDFKMYHANLKLAEEGRVKNKLRTGVWMKYFESGNLNYEIGYNEGRIHGIYKVWDESGSLIERSYWKNAKADSIMLLYYSNGNLKEKTPWILGERNGVCLKYYENGRIETKYEYKNDKLNGPCEKWSETGIKLFSIEHKEGKKNGTFIFYHDNGKISQKGTNMNGVPIGKLSFYNENGDLFEIDHYENGEIIRIEEF